MKDDIQLIKDYVEGDTKSLEDLVGRYIKSIYRFSYRVSGDPSEAQDITQEVFIKVWKNINKFNFNNSFKTWIFTIAHNTAIDHLRKKTALPFSSLDSEHDLFEEKLLDEQPLANEVFDQVLSAQQLDSLLATIPPDRKSIIMLHHIEGLTFADIAQVTNKPINTIKSQYRRTLKTLRRLASKPTLHQN